MPRGGSYQLMIMTDITNWHGEVLDKNILEHLNVNDVVRVIFEPNYTPRYIEITHILSQGYFKGVITDGRDVCDICKECNVKGKTMYQCENEDSCWYYYHLQCSQKFPMEKCNCNSKMVQCKPYLLNGSTIIFKRNNISEITSGGNMDKWIEIYKKGR